jgi:copper chaperone CopZ
MRSRLRDMELEVENIPCSGCAEDMARVLRETEGVLEASVNVSAGSIRVGYDEDVIDGRKVYLRVRKLGFPARIVSDHPRINERK